MTQTAVEYLEEQYRPKGYITAKEFEQAKEIEKQQQQNCYSQVDVLMAGKMGEINEIDTKHIISYLDEAKGFNQTYRSNP
jgi:hypothetical protein